MLTFAVSLLTTAVLVYLARPVLQRMDMIDTPSGRSMHSHPVVRGAGIAVVIGAIVGLLAAPSGRSLLGWTLVVIAAMYASIGWADDRRSRPVVTRLLGQVIVAAIAAAVVVGGADLGFAATTAGILAAMVVIVASVNAFNFMDGINGISSATATVAGAAYAIVGLQIDSDLLSAAGLALMAAFIGFLPFNFPRAQVFLGDVGSYFLGGYVAILVLIGLRADASVIALTGPLLLYAVDTSFTLLQRWRHGETVWEPHRDHVYQRLANGRLSQTATTLVIAALTGASAMLGLVAHDRGVAATGLCLVGLVAVAALYLLLPSLADRLGVSEPAS